MPSSNPQTTNVDEAVTGCGCGRKACPYCYEQLSLPSTPDQITPHLTPPMRAVLQAGDAEEHQAGIGTWMKLRRLGLVDSKFNLTQLGKEVAFAQR